MKRTKAELIEEIRILEFRIDRLRNPQTDDEKAEMASICFKTWAKCVEAIIVIFQLGAEYESQTLMEGNNLILRTMAGDLLESVEDQLQAAEEFNADPSWLRDINEDNDEE